MENISLEVSNKSVIIAQNENGEWVDAIVKGLPLKQRRILIRRKSNRSEGKDIASSLVDFL